MPGRRLRAAEEGTELDGQPRQPVEAVGVQRPVTPHLRGGLRVVVTGLVETAFDVRQHGVRAELDGHGTLVDHSIRSRLPRSRLGPGGERGGHEIIATRGRRGIRGQLAGGTRRRDPARLASGQSGPLSIRPCHGACRAPRQRPARLRATYHRAHGIRYFHGCYCVGDDQLRGITREHKGAGHTLAALKSIRAARPDGYRLFVIMDYVAANKTPAIRRWARLENVELCFTPANASWASALGVTQRPGKRQSRPLCVSTSRAGPEPAQGII